MVPVAFCTDRTMEAPLHVAAASLLSHVNPVEAARFYFLLTGFSSAHVDRLRRTLDRVDRHYEMRLLHAPDRSLFAGFRPLHGSLTPYHRLMLPDLVDEPRLLYLDSDTLPTIDVAPLMSIDMQGNSTAFVLEGTAKTDLESAFFLANGVDPERPVLNSGVMLLDIAEWKRQRCRERCLEFCRLHPGELQTADQTVLNVLFSSQTLHLPPEYNIKLYPNTRRQPAYAAGLYHFVGSPKPWDIGARWAHRSYAMWNAARAAYGVRRIAALDTRAWIRSLRILPSYHRTFRQRAAARDKTPDQAA